MNSYRPYRLSAVPRTLHTQLEIAKAIRTLAGPDEDELLRQRRAEIAAIRHDLDALIRGVRRLGEELPALVMAELKNTVPTSRACRLETPMAGSGRARTKVESQVHHQVSVVQNRAANSGRMGRHSKQRESRRGEFRRPGRLNVKHNMRRTFFNVRWWD